MAENRLRRTASVHVAIAIGALAIIIGLRLSIRGPQMQQHEKPPGGFSSVVSSPEPTLINAGSHREQQELGRTKGAAEVAGVNLVPLEQAKIVALRFANRRWAGARVGPTLLVHAPDGVPEAHFCLILKRGTREVSMSVLSERISALGRRRIELSRRLAEAGPDEVDELAARVRSLWDKMRGADKYATVVVGANDGREPFVASFDGLPPQMFLRNDAIEMRREQLGGADPGEPSVVWLPPLFVAFEFPPADGHGAGTYLQARGTQLVEVDLHKWRRKRLSEKLLQERRGKWRRFSVAPEE